MSEMLTAEEIELVSKLGECANGFGRIIGDGRTRIADLTEAVDKIHQLQSMVLSQAAARAYPTEFRLLGGVCADPGAAS